MTARAHEQTATAEPEDCTREQLLRLDPTAWAALRLCGLWADLTLVLDTSRALLILAARAAHAARCSVLALLLLLLELLKRS